MRIRSRIVDSGGYTLIETMMVVAIGVVLLAVTTVNIDRVVDTTRGDSALYLVMSELRQARDMAVNRRRAVQVDFIMPNQIRLTRYELPEGTTVLSDVFLEGHVQFRQFAGVPDTPDGFGNGGAIAFNGYQPVFIADGMLVDPDGAPLSGTVFLGIENEPASVRAVTVFGGTGQIRGYTYDWANSQWMEQ